MDKKTIYNISTTDKDIIDNISEEFKNGLTFLSELPASNNIVTVFGSARTKEDSATYKSVVDLTNFINTNGYSILTGGGPGLMEAANKGAFDAGGSSIGVNVVLPHEQESNPYVKSSFICDYLFTRKVFLIKDSEAFIFVEGGFGTLDELFEILTLISVEYLKEVPVILYGKEFWTGMMKWVKEFLLDRKYIDKDLFDNIVILDKKEEVLEKLKAIKK